MNKGIKTMDEIKFKEIYTINFTFTPSNFKTGMFGITTNNEWFVVVNDIIVYENGDYDNISSLHENLQFPTGKKIKKVFINCNSFNQAKKGNGVQIYPIPNQINSRF